MLDAMARKMKQNDEKVAETMEKNRVLDKNFTIVRDHLKESYSYFLVFKSI